MNTVINTKTKHNHNDVINNIMQIPDVIIERVADSRWQLSCRGRAGWFQLYPRTKTTVAILAFKITELQFDIQWAEQLNLQLATFEQPLDCALDYQDGCWWLQQQFISPWQAQAYQQQLLLQLTLADWMEQQAKKIDLSTEKEKASTLMIKKQHPSNKFSPKLMGEI